MNLALIKKYSGRFSQWRRLIYPLQREALCLLILGFCWGNSYPVYGQIIPDQLNLKGLNAYYLISQGSLPPSVEKAIREDLSRRTGLGKEQFRIKEVSRKTWPDGCLGLGSSNELCTQALVEGWRVVMENKGKTWVYRTDEGGLAVRVEE